MARSSSANPVEWWVPNHYRVGDSATWHGITLVCTRNHYAGDAAEHPWDPGGGWDVAEAASLWTPSGGTEAYNLLVRSQFEFDRLREVMVAAASG